MSIPIISDIKEIFKEIRKLVRGGDGSENTIQTIKDMSDGYLSNKNIRNMAKEAIMQFPMLVSDTVEEDSHQTLKNALERRYATFARIAIGIDDVMDFDDFDNKAEFIKKFHQNQDRNSSSLQTGLDELDEGVREYLIENIEGLNEELLITLDEDLEAKSLNDMTVKDYMLTEADDSDDEEEKEGKRHKEVKLKNRQVKKSNETEPVILEVEIEYRDKDAEKIKTTSLVFGVKCVSHLIEAPEMIENIANSVKEQSIIFRAIQWTTGEISFFKDFLLNLDSIKKDVKGNKDRNSSWWHHLKTRAHYNKFKRLFNKEEFLPNATMVLSMSDVEAMERKYGVELQEGIFITKVMDIFGLLSFVILDDVDEIAYLWDDEEGSWDHYSYSSLRSKGGKNKGNVDMKQLISLVGRK